MQLTARTEQLPDCHRPTSNQVTEENVMLSVYWIENKEGWLLANWYDHERAERGGFAETLIQMDDDLVLRDEAPGYEETPDLIDDDEDWPPAPPRFAAGARW
jgi:hypothetical protein